MATAEKETESLCGYCWGHLTSASDTRQIPCKHAICCRDCLDKHIEEQSGIYCLQCGTFYELVDADSLSKVNLGIQEQKASTNLTCDRKKCENKPAVVFCVNCDTKLCNSHQQSHQDHFDDEHDVITIQTYEQSPEKYKKVFCEHHTNEVLIKACKKCDKVACVECLTAEEDCPDDGNLHKFSSFTALTEEITSHYKQLLKSIEDEITEMCKVSKKTWRLLDDEEVKCKKWIDEIKLVRDEQIRMINEESETVIDKVQDYLSEVTNQVEVFDDQVMTKKDQLEVVRTRIRGLMKDQHVTERLREKREITTECIKSLDVEVGSCELTASTSYTYKCRLDKDFYFYFISSELDVGSGCYSACHREDGDILIGCEDGLWLLDGKDKSLTKCKLPFETVTSVIEHHHSIYILHHEKWTCKVEMCLPDLTHTQTLFEFNIPTNSAAYMSVSDRYIVVRVYGDPRQLIIYDIINKQTKTLQVTTPYHPYFLPDGHLLTVGFDELTKNSLEDEQLTPIWTCKGLPKIITVCTDSNGLIYACTYVGQNSIYIISPSGTKLQTFTYVLDDMGIPSVRGNQLAVPGMGDKKLHLLTINYS